MYYLAECCYGVIILSVVMLNVVAPSEKGKKLSEWSNPSELYPQSLDWGVNAHLSKNTLAYQAKVL